MASKLNLVSWILLALVGALTLFGSLASMGVAYFQGDDQLGATTLHELTAEAPEAKIAIQARRGTAAAFGAGYAVALLVFVLGPYRRGEASAWWAVLAMTLTTNGLILLRIPTLGTTLGLGQATIPLGVSAIALLLGATRLKGT